MKPILLSLSAILLISCADSDKAFYKAMEKRNQQYSEAYKGVENGRITFKGKFDGEITMVEAKALPQIQQLRQPETTSETVLKYLGVLAPSAVALGSMHYNYKSDKVHASANRDIAISGNEKDANIFNGYASNYKNDSTTSSTTNSNSDISNVTSTINDSQSITDTSVTDTTGTTSTVNTTTSVPTVIVDATGASVTP